MPRCSRSRPTWGRCARCIACSRRPTKCGNGAPRPDPVPLLLDYSLYVILDLFSRYVMGWMVARHENAHLAERLIAATCLKQGIAPQQLTIHADRGAPMRSKLVALLFSDLSINASHSRPRVSNDNPFSESQFRTLKYS